MFEEGRISDISSSNFQCLWSYSINANLTIRLPWCAAKEEMGGNLETHLHSFMAVELTPLEPGGEEGGGRLCSSDRLVSTNFCRLGCMRITIRFARLPQHCKSWKKHTSVFHYCFHQIYLFYKSTFLKNLNGFKDFSKPWIQSN